MLPQQTSSTSTNHCPSSSEGLNSLASVGLASMEMADQSRAATKFINTSFFLKKFLQFLFSLSIFSFLLSFTSILNNSISSDLLPFQLFNYTVDRIYMFLLCNGILVFLATNSGLIRSSSPFMTDLHYDQFKSNGHHLRPIPQAPEMELEASVIEKDEIDDDEVENIDGCLEKNVVGKQEQVRNRLLLEQEEEESNGFLNLEEIDEDDGEGENGLLSTEELNKKFDDFIKKMKEEIRLEAQRQVIRV
ncbi:PREDICTED: uncharacterized protein LOC104606614 [Nelumbo nucifera]|uniref:Uncharacterized protein LOC104606614 n=2 Tax=Nelumbo nucifera TaxID=4432 RepID=A0A1U8B2K8_NELNU|nr:PREDICTED: uncharacterized protein LOC104606614 [Nelumbo nucifera]DAD20246.1 TPA_asm: hypothetical protein HUJ06_021709 [Nelumbo nucifera]